MFYDRKTLINYIKGNEIKDYNKKELENDPNFMKEVIELTNDRNMYKKCSKELKGNYKFIKDLVYKYIDDLPFIEEMISNFILYNKNKNSNESIELTLMMLSNTPYEERRLSDCIDVYSFYKYYMNHVELALNDEENIEIINELGKGFIFLYYEFENYPNIVEFFATEYLKEMFFEHESCIEELIHSKFKNKADIDKVGINNFLLNYIASYDPMLSNYISLRLYLLDDIKEEIINTKNNWDEYLNRLNEIRKLIIDETIEEFINSNIYNNSFNCYKELNDILKEYNIEYDLTNYNLKDTDYITNDKCINFSKILFIKKVKELINILYKEDYIDYTKLEELKTPKINKETKVYKLEFNKKN